MRDHTGGGEEALGRVLGVDAALDRMAVVLDVVLRERERLARRDPQLLGDEVERRDHLGDAVLHLQAGVHLEEPELAVLVQTLHGACVHVATRAGHLDRGFVHRRAHVVAEVARRALLDELLVPALRGAVALAERHDVAVRVGEHLQLDVTRLGEVALDVALVAAEVGQRLALGRLEGFGGLGRAARDLEPLAATAVRGLDRDRPAELLAEGHDLRRVLDRFERARHREHVGCCGGLPGRDLVAHDLDGLGGRSDPGHPARGDRAGEVGVLGEEAVPGVHRLGATALDRVEDGLGVEIALGRGLAAERVGLVGVANVEGVAVELGVDRDGGDPELATRAHDPHRDLSAVGDEDFGEHGPSSMVGARFRAGTHWRTHFTRTRGGARNPGARRDPPTRARILRRCPDRPVPPSSGVGGSSGSTSSIRPTGTCSERPGRVLRMAS